MNERENFLARWSRRKLELEEQKRAEEAVAEKPDAAPNVEAEQEAATPSADASANSAKKEEPEFDFLSLPSIESITATTDIRAFLTPGVPPEITRAALRRAWSVDPNIRDYVGLAENQWDFNSPGIPGFGPLDLTEDLRKIVAEIVGGTPSATSEPEVKAEAAKSDQTTPEVATPSKAIESAHAKAVDAQPAPGPRAMATGTTVLAHTEPSPNYGAHDENVVQHSNNDAALQNRKDEQKELPPPQRGHGSALPE
jgi:hypothetical protein